MSRVILFGLSGMLTASLACNSEQAAQSANTQAAAPPVSEPKPEPEPEQELPPPPPEAVLPENCEIIIEGGDDIRQAMVHTQSGLVETKIVNGRELTFVCPPAAERLDTDVIAERSLDEVVHWTKVDLDPAAATRLANDDALPNLPAHLTPEELAQLKVEMPNLSLWDELEGGKDAAPDAQDVKIPVSFSANELYSAKLKIRDKRTGRTLKLRLDPDRRRSLAPGRYELEVTIDDKQWRDAGTIEIEAGKSRYSVRMLDAPPWHEISSR